MAALGRQGWRGSKPKTRTRSCESPQHPLPPYTVARPGAPSSAGAGSAPLTAGPAPSREVPVRQGTALLPNVQAQRQSQQLYCGIVELLMGLALRTKGALCVG